ncbi:hypothetical protein [uncultured Lacinutrix sp.]|uniref:hypothetical protein n=1 Tax=uncultured Lacinutrix sp. TaxID=574032 RepID=UPI002625C2AF|nr:hypothetical protein [uncultured Lacinutrix sp.]
METLEKLKKGQENSDAIYKKTKTEIRTIKDLWKAVIEAYDDEDYDTEAMRDVYKRMNPKITYQDVANVFAAVYADTYWSVIKMDPSILSKSMVQGLSLDRAQANKYATNAMKQWRGSFSRNNKSDRGQIPSPGSYSQSIDIVCNQDTELEPAQLINEWNNEFWKTPSVGKNYVYVRVQNLEFRGELAPKAQMFYADGGFNQPPSSWNQCLTAKDGSQEGEILSTDNEPALLDRGDRGASEAFNFSPKSAAHVCVIGAINDQYFTLNSPLGVSDGNWNSATWLTHNGASVWHNVNPQIAKVTSLKIYNQDGTKEKFVLNAQCRNVPVGSTINIATKDNCFLTEKPITIHNSSQFLEIEGALPGYYEGDLQVTIQDANGKLLPSNAAIEFTLLWKLEKGHDFYAKAANTYSESESLKNEQAIYTSLGSYTIRGAE